MANKRLPIIADSTDPRITAERLLKSVLPEELYIQLAATGEFRCTIHKLKFTFKRNAKTRVVRSGREFSCCIDVEDEQRPDQDRIVAEYLLALNDHKKYMEIANLTDVTPGSRGGLTFGVDWAAAIDYWADFGQVGVRIGDTINIRRPARYGPRPELRLDPPIQPTPTPDDNALSEVLQMDDELRWLRRAPYITNQPPTPGVISELHISQIANECLRQITQHERMRGIRFMQIPQSMCRRPDVVYAESIVTTTAFASGNHRQIIDMIYQAVVPGLVEVFVANLMIHPIIGIFPLEPRFFRGRVGEPEPEAIAVVTDPRTNLSIDLAKIFDRDRQAWIYRLACGVERPG